MKLKVLVYLTVGFIATATAQNVKRTPKTVTSTAPKLNTVVQPSQVNQNSTNNQSKSSSGAKAIETQRMKRLVGKPVKELSQNNFETTTSGTGYKQLAPNNSAPSQIAKTTSTTQTSINIGQSSNLLGYYVGGKSHIWADPNSGLVAHVHRSYPSVTGDANSGFLRVSLSKNNGTTWQVNQGPAFNGSVFSPARYPQVALYNPYPGTGAANNPDSTYIIYSAPTLDNSNPGPGSATWGGLAYGVYKPNGVQKTQHSVSSNANVSRFHLIPSDFHATQDGHTWSIDIGGNQSNIANPYNDTIYLEKGTWNAASHDFDLSLVKVYAPVTHLGGDRISDAHIAFGTGANSNIGWISFLGHDSFSFQPDSISYPILYKTTNGGITWTGPIRVNLNNLPGLTNAGDSLYYDNVLNPGIRRVPQFKHDLAVDNAGVPHIVLSIGLIQYSDSSGNIFAAWSTTIRGAMTTIWANNASGASWSGKFLAWPKSFYNCYGDCDPIGADRYIDYNRPQIATNWSGNKMFFIWADTDPNMFPPLSTGFDLQNPDVWAAGQDLLTNNWTYNADAATQSISLIAKNMTKQTSADAQAIYANLSYYVFEPTSGTFELPISYSEFDISASGAALAATAVQHKYLKGALLDFTQGPAVTYDLSGQVSHTTAILEQNPGLYGFTYANLFCDTLPRSYDVNGNITNNNTFPKLGATLDITSSNVNGQFGSNPIDVNQNYSVDTVWIGGFYKSAGNTGVVDTLQVEIAWGAPANTSVFELGYQNPAFTSQIYATPKNTGSVLNGNTSFLSAPASNKRIIKLPLTINDTTSDIVMYGVPIPNGQVVTPGQIFSANYTFVPGQSYSASSIIDTQSPSYPNTTNYFGAIIATSGGNFSFYDGSYGYSQIQSKAHRYSNGTIAGIYPIWALSPTTQDEYANLVDFSISADLVQTATGSINISGPGNSITCGTGINLAANVNYFGSGTVTLQWSPTTGINNPTAQYVIASPTTPTTYVCSLLVNGAVIATSNSYFVNVNPIAISPVTTYSTNCGSTLNIQLNGPSANSTYTWSPSGIFNNATTTTSSNTTLTLTASQNVTVTCATTGCGSTQTSFPITVTSPNYSVAFIQSQQLFTAPPFNVLFQNQTPNSGNYTFVWYFGDGTSYAGLNPPVHTYTTNGNWDVTLIATSISTGCTDTLFKPGWIVTTGGVACTHSATITQSSPVNACAGDTVHLSCNTDATFSYQWQINGVALAGANSSTYNATVNGYYSVKIIKSGCPVVSADVQVIFNALPSAPTITVTNTTYSCSGSTATLQANNGYTGYIWSNLATGQVTTITNSGAYTVTGYNAAGCSAISAPYIFNAAIAATPPVCIVTVDSLSTHNIVIWEKPVVTNISSFKVYRVKTALLDTLLGTVPYANLSEFHDLTCNPNVTQYDYKISIVDSCGIESLKSAAHRTILMTSSLGTGLTTANLNWNLYIGNTVNQYLVYRDDNLTGNFQQIATLSPASTSYIDNNLPANNGFAYRIEVNWVTSCTPTAKAMVTTNTTRSNTKDNYRVSGLKEASNSQLNLFPNPVNELLNVSVNNGQINNVNVFDATGRLIKTMSVSNKNNQVQINTSDLARGIYFMEVNTNAGTVRKSFVRE